MDELIDVNFDEIPDDENTNDSGGCTDLCYERKLEELAREMKENEEKVVVYHEDFQFFILLFREELCQLYGGKGLGAMAER